ncbi:MAG TPA: tryptophan synthase subunit alpha [Longimicrobiales bacterium]
MSQTTSSEPDRLAARFAALRAEGRRALIPYIPAGYPALDATPDLLDRLARAGADVIEFGVPFSDPLADGPTVQRASFRALEAGVTLDWTLDTLAGFHQRDETPVILFTYLNPVMAYGVDRFLRDAAAAGAAGALVLDLPVGSDPALEDAFEASPLPLVRLIAPTTPAARAIEIAQRAQGFLYYISRTGVTGASDVLRTELAQEVAALRARTKVPVAVGFGISTPEQAQAVGRVADGVVVGSALINALDRGGPAEAEAFLASLRRGVDGDG